MNKYKNKKVYVDGIRFDSKREANRYKELLLLEQAGEITDIELQKDFLLIPPQKIGGKVVERAVKYKADFCYKDSNGKMIVEDVKGMKTKDYIIKRKLMLYVHGVRVKEV